MAKNIHIGVSSISHKAKSLYMGGGNIAKKIKSMYIGDASGKARSCINTFIPFSLLWPYTGNNDWKICFSNQETPNSFSQFAGQVASSGWSGGNLLYSKNTKRFYFYQTRASSTYFYVLPEGSTTWTAVNLTTYGRETLYYYILDKSYNSSTADRIIGYRSTSTSSDSYFPKRVIINSDYTLSKDDARVGGGTTAPIIYINGKYIFISSYSGNLSIYYGDPSIEMSSTNSYFTLAASIRAGYNLAYVNAKFESQNNYNYLLRYSGGTYYLIVCSTSSDATTLGTIIIQTFISTNLTTWTEKSRLLIYSGYMSYNYPIHMDDTYCYFITSSEVSGGSILKNKIYYFNYKTASGDISSSCPSVNWSLGNATKFYSVTYDNDKGKYYALFASSLYTTLQLAYFTSVTGTWTLTAVSSPFSILTNNKSSLAMNVNDNLCCY